MASGGIPAPRLVPLLTIAVPKNAVGKVEVELHGNHTANRIADQDGLFVAGCVKNGGHVRGHLGNGIAGFGFIRTPVAAMIDRNALIIPGKREGLKIPDIAVGRKRMQKHKRRSRPVAFVIHIHAISMYMRHGALLHM